MPPGFHVLSRPTCERLALCALLLVLLGLRLPFLAGSFDDIDGLNFDLGIHDYDPTAHRPHPPGYPAYIALARLPHGWFDSHATAVAAVNATFGALSAMPMYFLFRELTSPSRAAAAAIVTFFNPLVWFTSVRPMSDLVGLCIATLGQCLAMAGLRSDRKGAWHAAAIIAGIAGGVRIQTLLLTVPILVLGCVRRPSWIGGTAIACAAGVLAWFVPLIVAVGGWQPLVAAVLPVGQDVLAFESLAHRATLRQLARAAIDTFVTPWHSPALAAVMLALAAAGCLRLAGTDRTVLGYTLVLFAPYSVCHLFVQDVHTVRYAIPIVPLVAMWAVAALPATRPLLLGTTAVVLAASLLTVPALRAYEAIGSPAARAVAHINAQPAPSVATGHYVFDRYLTMLDADVERLPPAETGEWRALTRFWREGRDTPVWFLRQPTRMTLLLFGHDTQEVVGRWAWPEQVQPLINGARPDTVELVRISPPRWLTEQGFMARFEDRFSGVESNRHRLWLRGSKRERVFIASGALTTAAEPAELLLRSGDTTVARWTVGGSFSIHGAVPTGAAPGYSPLSLESSAPFVVHDVWFERADRPVVRPGRGFHVAERDARARLFRWTSARAHATAYLPDEAARLRLVGEAPPPQILPVTLALDWNGEPIGSVTVNTRQFRYEVDLHRGNTSAWGELTLTTSPTFIPHEVSGTGDHRALGVRIYELSLSKVTADGARQDPDRRPISSGPCKILHLGRDSDERTLVPTRRSPCLH